MKISIKPMWGHIRWTSKENTLPQLLWCENKIAFSSPNEYRLLVVPTVFFLCSTAPAGPTPVTQTSLHDLSTRKHLIGYLFQNAKFLFKLHSWDLHRPTKIIVALICFVKEVNILKRYRFWRKFIMLFLKFVAQCNLLDNYCVFNITIT